MTWKVFLQVQVVPAMREETKPCSEGGLGQGLRQILEPFQR